MGCIKINNAWHCLQKIKFIILNFYQKHYWISLSLILCLFLGLFLGEDGMVTMSSQWQVIHVDHCRPWGSHKVDLFWEKADNSDSESKIFSYISFVDHSSCMAYSYWVCWNLLRLPDSYNCSQVCASRWLREVFMCNVHYCRTVVNGSTLSQLAKSNSVYIFIMVGCAAPVCFALWFVWQRYNSAVQHQISGYQTWTISLF